MDSSRLDELMRGRDLSIDKLTGSEKDIIYISGSVAEGFGNSYSDIDVFVVYADKKPYMFPIIKFDSPVFIDYEIPQSFDEMRAVADTINSMNLEDSEAVSSVSGLTMDLYYRTLIGHPILNPAGFQALVEWFDRDRFARFYRVHADIAAAKQVSQALAWLALGYDDLAIEFARVGYVWAFESLTARHGEAFPSKKWLFEKVKRAFGEDSLWYQRAWELKSPGNLTASAFVGAVKDLCDNLDIVLSSQPEKATYSQGRISLHKETQVHKVLGDSYVTYYKSAIFKLSDGGSALWEAFGKEASFQDAVDWYSSSRSLDMHTARRHVRDFLEELWGLGLATFNPQLLAVQDPVPATVRDAEASAPFLTKLPVTAAEFVHQLFYSLRLYNRRYVAALFDILGARDARQMGTVATRCTELVLSGISVYLCKHGRYFVDTPYSIEVLKDVLGSSHDTYKQASKLLAVNCEDDAAVERHLSDCHNFVDEVLELRWFHEQFSRLEIEGWVKCFDTYLELASMAESIEADVDWNLERLTRMKSDVEWLGGHKGSV